MVQTKTNCCWLYERLAKYSNAISQMQFFLLITFRQYSSVLCTHFSFVTAWTLLKLSGKKSFYKIFSSVPLRGYLWHRTESHWTQPHLADNVTHLCHFYQWFQTHRLMKDRDCCFNNKKTDSWRDEVPVAHTNHWNNCFNINVFVCSVSGLFLILVLHHHFFGSHFQKTGDYRLITHCIVGNVSAGDE